MKTYREAIYEKYYTNRRGKTIPVARSGMSSRKPFYLRIINDHFPEDRNCTILDLGCGYGPFIYSMNEAGYKNARGVDGSLEAVEVANKFNISGVEKGDVIQYLSECKDNSVDVITAIDLIEHFTKQEIFDLVRHFYRVLKKGGKVITHQPNGEGVFGGVNIFGDFTHELALTRVSISQVFLGNGFESINSYEDKPIVHGVVSLLRRLIWDLLVRPFYLFLVAVESGGDWDILLTKNFLSVAVK